MIFFVPNMLDFFLTIAQDFRLSCDENKSVVPYETLRKQVSNLGS